MVSPQMLKSFTKVEWMSYFVSNTNKKETGWKEGIEGLCSRSIVQSWGYGSVGKMLAVQA